MSTTFEPTGEEIRIALTGSLDSLKSAPGIAASALRQVEELLHSRRPSLVRIDFHGLTYIDSAAFRQIVDELARLRSRVRVELSGPGPALERLFEIVRPPSWWEFSEAPEAESTASAEPARAPEAPGESESPDPGSFAPAESGREAAPLAGSPAPAALAPSPARQVFVIDLDQEEILRESEPPQPEFNPMLESLDLLKSTRPSRREAPERSEDDAGELDPGGTTETSGARTDPPAAGAEAGPREWPGERHGEWPGEWHGERQRERAPPRTGPECAEGIRFETLDPGGTSGVDDLQIQFEAGGEAGIEEERFPGEAAAPRDRARERSTAEEELGAEGDSFLVEPITAEPLAFTAEDRAGRARDEEAPEAEARAGAGPEPTAREEALRARLVSTLLSEGQLRGRIERLEKEIESQRGERGGARDSTRPPPGAAARRPPPRSAAPERGEAARSREAIPVCLRGDVARGAMARSLETILDHRRRAGAIDGRALLNLAAALSQAVLRAPYATFDLEQAKRPLAPAVRAIHATGLGLCLVARRGADRSDRSRLESAACLGLLGALCGPSGDPALAAGEGRDSLQTLGRRLGKNLESLLGRGRRVPLREEALLEDLELLALGGSFWSAVETGGRGSGLEAAEAALALARGEVAPWAPPELRRLFLQTFSHFPPGSWVRLETGELGVALSPGEADPRFPLVLCLLAGGTGGRLHPRHPRLVDSGEGGGARVAAAIHCPLAAGGIDAGPVGEGGTGGGVREIFRVKGSGAERRSGARGDRPAR